MDVSLNEKLYQAVSRADIISVNKLLSKGARANVTSSSGKTALGAAANLGNVEILKLLLDNDYPCVSPSDSLKWNKLPLMPSSGEGHRGLVYGGPCEYHLVPETCGSQEYPTMGSSIQGPPYLYPFTIDYSQQNQGYYVFIHDDSSPVVSPDWAGAEGLEWDEEVGGEGEEALPTSEDDTWTTLYKWYAQMLEQTEGLLGSPEGHGGPAPRPRDVPDARQRSAAHYAAEQGHVGALRLLLQAGCKIDSVDSSGFTPLHLAVSRGHLGAARVLLGGGADPGRRALPHHPSTPLHIAAAGGHQQLIELLISAGAPLEVRDSAEKTALQTAAEYAQVEAVKLLVQVGANINVEDINGSTPLCEAVRQGQVEIVRVLLEFGARAPPHHHLLHYAVLHRQAEVAKVLVEAGAWVDLRDDNGDTPLLLAARSGQAALAQMLLEKGASVDYPNSLTGSTALHEAVECVTEYATFEEVFTCLQEHDVNLNTTSLVSGDTPLFRAILLQRDKVAELLIKHGADVNLCSLQHCVVDNLSLALARGSHGVARLLVLAGAPPPPSWGRHPRPLAHLARLTLRSLLRPAPLFKSVRRLPLPTPLKGFLMLEDED